MPDTSSSSTSSPVTTKAQVGSADDLASLHKELYNAEKTADALEGRLDGLEKRLDELLEALESKEKELEAAKSKTKPN
jgi:predicted nuclease with TOPRIM domain